MAILTDRSLRRKWAGKDEWLSDGGSRGAGRLVAKLSAGGIIFYFQYYISGRRRFLQIGPYDPKSERGQTPVGRPNSPTYGHFKFPHADTRLTT